MVNSIDTSATDTSATDTSATPLKSTGLQGYLKSIRFDQFELGENVRFRENYETGSLKPKMLIGGKIQQIVPSLVTDAGNDRYMLVDGFRRYFTIDEMIKENPEITPESIDVYVIPDEVANDRKLRLEYQLLLGDSNKSLTALEKQVGIALWLELEAQRIYDQLVDAKVSTLAKKSPDVSLDTINKQVQFEHGEKFTKKSKTEATKNATAQWGLSQQTLHSYETYGELPERWRIETRADRIAGLFEAVMIAGKYSQFNKKFPELVTLDEFLDRVLDIARVEGKSAIRDHADQAVAKILQEQSAKETSAKLDNLIAAETKAELDAAMQSGQLAPESVDRLIAVSDSFSSELHDLLDQALELTRSQSVNPNEITVPSAQDVEVIANQVAAKAAQSTQNTEQTGQTIEEVQQKIFDLACEFFIASLGVDFDPAELISSLKVRTTAYQEKPNGLFYDELDSTSNCQILTTMENASKKIDSSIKHHLKRVEKSLKLSAEAALARIQVRQEMHSTEQPTEQAS